MLLSGECMRYILYGIMAIFLSSATIVAQIATAPALGTGSYNDPYQIVSLNNLYWITQNTDKWVAHYLQKADINASATSSWDSGRGFLPLGTVSVKFTGSYDGDRYTIDSLFIDRDEVNSDYIGFFGCIRTAYLKDILLVDV